jgi:dipeptidyl aminopeptidase/acylaminoacyl peptidase
MWVQDTRHYDPVVQYLASWGFAVLQVNYRGSSGYGVAFLESGKREWAQGIEDDIDAAVETVLARPEIDGTRICIAGGSYGGFSAVASLQRHPDRYRCGASLNGVSDLLLHLEQGECAERESCREALEEIIGDPEAERGRLIALSPAYHVRDISAPLLVAHGTRDWRVHPDQSHRLILMLETFGKPHETFEIVGAGHFLDSREWVGYLRTLRRFLTQHLLPGTPFRPDPIPEQGPAWIVPIRLAD